MARFLGAASEREVIVGPSVTSLTFALSRSIARALGPGDEIVVTRMDHDGNVSPWLAAAQDRSNHAVLFVRHANVAHRTAGARRGALEQDAAGRTQLRQQPDRSINDVRGLVKKIHAAGALAYVDAVQFAPHGCIDVDDLGCDFLACSSYKFFGPHLGIV